jgi:hypothetical protein
MSTVFVFDQELNALVTAANADILLVHDASTGIKKDVTVSNVATAITGAAASNVIGFYGTTKVNQGTMTATALTALTTNPTFSASNTGAGVYGFASSTAAVAIVKRMSQAQADLETFMARIESTGLVAIAGVP